MPSHQDRVRRNYHDIEIKVLDDIVDNIQILYTKITRCDIASCISHRDLEYMIIRKIREEIRKGYKI